MATDGIQVQLDVEALAKVVHTGFLGTTDGGFDDEDLGIAKAVIESTWFSDVITKVQTETIRVHGQAIARAHNEATVQAIADAEIRGYQRQLDERVVEALEALKAKLD